MSAFFTPTVTLIALVVLAMLSAGGLAYGFLFTRIRTDAQAARRLGEIEDRPTGAAAVKAKADPARRRKSVQDTLKELEQKERAKAEIRSRPSLNVRLQQAGLSFGRRGFILMSVVSGLVPLAVCFIVLRLPIYATLAFGLAGALGFPLWAVNFLRKRRFKKFLKEFPNAVDVIVRGVKAGLPLNDCLRIIANESAEPVKTEFRLIHESQQLGLSVTEAVARMPERVPVPEANFFSIVIAIQQRAGGNLAEALGNLSKVLRERAKMGGKIKAMSMEAKASGVIIGALPIIVMLLVYLSSPDYISLLFTDQLGNVILGAAAVWMLLGIIVMRRMINFDF